ncbi:MAG: two-component system response regulator [Bdellovibrionales bacterium RIFCSPHIGHO2_01_FULL_40_29]|nr:MAG: two-component system response regulator [Bdellovibrionales bacterium RIFCSPHIGHO2_01_FULL_40_29]OFZ32566.1 MAG: two-component system response regulator [Bdellovibrionales bacterium RIFCSPHIGHO2_02_FULL_40_15]
MKITKNPVPILVADDDLDDCQMIKEALQESRLLNEIHFVHDGEQLLKYLQFENLKEFPIPGLILLDLNMPKKDGREALKEIKSNPKLRQIPVVVLTTSKAEEDILRTYNLGVNSFITKPIAFKDLVQTMTDLGRYWFEIVELPDRSEGRE